LRHSQHGNGAPRADESIAQLNHSVGVAAGCWSMMSSENRFALFGIMRHLNSWSMMSSENRFALFGIML
jgi:hypothetical protein